MADDPRHGPLDCTLCRGWLCHGGGNRGCKQRDPKPSRIGAVIDTYGSIRTVVAHKAEFRHHVRPDELLVIVPGLAVHTPIAWNDIASVIERAKYEAEKWMENNKPNEPHKIEAISRYRLRCLEQNQESLDLSSIVET